MLTEGRLRRIKSHIDIASRDVLHKFCCELVDEVERLRKELRRLADANTGTADPRVMANCAAAALKEPDLGQPDIVCRSEGIDKSQMGAT